jgi:hypothetical protein
VFILRGERWKGNLLSSKVILKNKKTNVNAFKQKKIINSNFNPEFSPLPGNPCPFPSRLNF